MKKVSMKFIGANVGFVVLASLIIGGIFALCGNDFLTMFIVAFLMIGIIVLLMYTESNFLTKSLMEKTIAQNVPLHNFEDCHTFYSSYGTLKIDEANGRIAYVAFLNPCEFQVISAKDIDDIDSSYIKGPFGGTNYVYFQFCYNGKKMRIPTFTARKAMYSLKSAEVLEGISKADAYALILMNAKINAK